MFAMFSLPQKQRQKMSSAMREGYEIYFQIKGTCLFDGFKK